MGVFPLIAPVSRLVFLRALAEPVGPIVQSDGLGDTTRRCLTVIQPMTGRPVGGMPLPAL